MSASADVQLVAGLARRLRERVAPELGSHAGRAHAGGGEGGDVTFAVDAAAEDELEAFMAGEAPRCAYFSEDRGLVRPDGAERVLVVDPIDGTRPAMAGLEAACVSVALAPLAGAAPGGGPAMGDVAAACVMEIKSGKRFVSVRGRGLVADDPVRLSGNTDLRRLFWTYGLRGRPARATMEVLGDLVDASSVGGGTFELGSACFDLTGSSPASSTPTWSPARGWSRRSRACAPSSSGSATGPCSTTPRTTWRPRRSASPRAAAC